MRELKGTRYGLPPSGTAYQLGLGDIVEVRLRDFYKGYICVGKRKFSCAFFKTTTGSAWIYCSKGRFIDIVQWIDKLGDFDTVFYLQYAAGALTPYTKEDLLRLDLWNQFLQKKQQAYLPS